ncbi:MAG TPA: DUF58 domain-containing protein [Bryobacteraceae bacterium]|nr:DUF58 domain-containing protein [Bryobacteraceae bacterium]
MIVPSQRLLLLAAVVVLPLATAGGFVPGLAEPCIATLALGAAVAAVDALRGRERLDALRPRLPAIQRFTKDVPSRLPITIENRSTAALPVRLSPAMPESVTSASPVEETIAAAGSSVFEWQCTGTARGDHSLGALHLETLSPFGLWMVRGAAKVECALRVYPNLRDRATAMLFQRTASIGLRMRRQVGKGREFDNLRQYLPGDSYEDIYWKASARRHFPVVKLYRVEHAQEIYAVVDSSRLSAREGILESYVNAALHLALVAERQGDRFGLVTFSDRTHRFLRARSGMDHFRLCRETIYSLQARKVSPDFRDVFTTLQLNLRRRALLVFFTSLDDALLAETFEQEVALLARRHVVLANVTQPPGIEPLFTDAAAADLDSLYGSLAGQILSNRMRQLKIALSNRGVRLSVVDPQRIKTQVTSEYLEVKRRQVL